MQLRRNDRRSGGFTLIEILVATAVLIILVAMVASIVQSGNTVISSSRKHLSADSQAREVFGQFGMDLARMPRRLDLDVLTSSSNNAIFFYSEAPGFQSTTDTRQFNKLSLVGYRVNDKAQLERLGKGLNWENQPFLTFSTQPLTTNATPLPASTIAGAWGSTVGSSPAYGNGTDDNYHLLADGVFRIYYCFQTTNGTFTKTPVATAMTGPLGDATSLILTLAILDEDSRKIATDSSKLASALPEPDLSNGKLPAETWQSAVDNVDKFAQDAGIPTAAASRVRIYQRSFPLTSP
ncbi:type IV pilin N-term methylation site GFxxxE [Terrimicrobium sacchariphilum]|uniref:Type IV pilin N-term methylation site GFxxxE n=1 Tax=Terrimicrobium sacchariphilum TaxID=690879 RepID=A0A146G4F8_TERSA|nr:prepilin-type N-terminal cleavage/methylation domain-containing protein [Terrimicrobium sacchariphilum]GAT32322.1 type IV pilin N-term methylation site GFxxxE [Terrimicrobium sacchariphilum]